MGKTVSNQSDTCVRRAYNEPCLVEYGALTDLTRASSASKPQTENMCPPNGTNTMKEIKSC